MGQRNVIFGTERFYGTEHFYGTEERYFWDIRNDSHLDNFLEEEGTGECGPPEELN